ncbi:MAG TPA: hypothetical protein VKV37_23530 [Ktedonobacteraceae bacterium]|nr:hypothetical protein [Ktedonobacteraceae bacterium]
MIETLSNPVQSGGWLLLLALAAVLVWLILTRPSAQEQSGDLIREGLECENEENVVEGSLAQTERTESDAT